MAGIAEFNWVTALAGGVLIGLATTLLLAFSGRIAGVTGIVNGAITFKKSDGWRWLFLINMVLGAMAYEFFLAPHTSLPATPRPGIAPVAMIVGGFIVGFGTRMGNGCTSGHGVCGLGRLSTRSLVAVILFLGASFVTVFAFRHLGGV